jgi:CRISPR-associated endonuclease/helicase Cas3
VVTPQGAQTAEEADELNAIIDRVRGGGALAVGDLRRLQEYTTSLHLSVLRRPGVVSLLRPIIGGEVVVPGSLNAWVGEYDPDTGISLDPGLEAFVQ